MEHERATIAQIREGKGGFFEVAGDVFQIVEQIGEIDENLRVWPKGDYWLIREVCKDGKERDVTTAQELDGRLLEHLRRISQPSYKAMDELEKQEDQRLKEIDHKTHEEMGEKGEVLAHAVRKDLNPGKIFVPEVW